MAKKTAKRKARKQTPSNKRRAAGARAAARSGAGARRTAKARRNTGRKTAGAKTPKGKAARKRTARAGKVRKGSGGSRGSRGSKGSKGSKGSRPVAKRRGGTGREETLAQTPETGRSVRGRTNPMPTKRSTGTPAGAGSSRRSPSLDRARKQLRELEETVPSPPSSLDLERTPSAARSGRAGMRAARENTNETGPELTGGDVDADWGDAYAVGDEAPGGDNPTPDQDVVDEIGKALGVEYQDNEELKAADKIAERDKHRWELDPASSDDYKDRD